MKLEKLYKNRFSSKEYRKKTLIWQSLCANFFERSVGGNIKPQDDILDIACGYGEFINNIGRAKNNTQIGKRIAVDLNKDALNYVASDVTFHNGSASNLSFLEKDSVDVIFVSNFFEHIQDKNEILQILGECKRVLRPNGKLLILQPNIRYVKEAYWDFFDHYTPLTEKSMLEALAIVSDFEVQKCYKRFLPYTTKSKIPQHPFLVKLYCLLPVMWKFMGKQMYIVAIKK